MNELSIAAKLLFTVGAAVLVLSAVRPLSHLTYKMAEAALEAQLHDQMSYGKFSRQLWSDSSKK